MKKQGETKHLLYRYVSAHIPPPPKAGRKANPRPNAWFPLQIASCRCSAFSSCRRPIFLVSLTHAGPIKALRSSSCSPFVVPYSDHNQTFLKNDSDQKGSPRQLSFLVTAAPLLSIQSALVITLHIKGSN
ncbi:hypothetical protein M431DRAFT_511900 [Trichoderma harzianum CBS 226.95]|uniref:Uncharacterized protein n=1 Tax=Trichoderma harzianum CBS 226.95 TaxID=983964 RepID=A0A2T3ZZV0_TRIHA|nr:hypothetical protein M431DRAFT_511900 [Trichoderma harzianum CBS 226.95]PTB50329.1 hypothetical protein M431DRAFT_511900 [Trichoderma harzianum CBS 226.95]